MVSGEAPPVRGAPDFMAPGRFRTPSLFVACLFLASLPRCLSGTDHYYSQALPGPPAGDYFEDYVDEYYILNKQYEEKSNYGTEGKVRHYNNARMGNTVIMQRSGRKRLYDHNIFLRALFEGRVQHKEFWSLRRRFRDAIFIDLGSAILYEEGAPTVRDLYEDPHVYPYLGNLVATDINDSTSMRTMFVTLYYAERNNLPFLVLEIDKTLVRAGQIQQLVELSLEGRSARSSVIFRSTNSGPDLFYTVDQIKDHFEAIIQANEQRDVLYFFHKNVLFKPKGKPRFQKLGEIDENVGLARRGNEWTHVWWEGRTLSESFVPNPKYVEIED